MVAGITIFPGACGHRMPPFHLSKANPGSPLSYSGTSMFDFVRRHNRIFQGALLVLIVPSFVAFGIQGYDSFSDEKQEVAKVNGRSISKTELDAALRSQLERLQTQMPGMDPKLLDSPELRARALDALVRERLMFDAAVGLHLLPTDERLDRLFKTDPQFAALRNADGSLKRELLQARGLTSEQFAAQLRQELAMRQVTSGVTDTSFGAQTVASRAVDAFFQQREIQFARFDTSAELAKVQVSDAELQAYYDDPAHQARLMSPESADIEYLVLDLPAVARSVTVTDDELRSYYKENQARYSTPEERRASHILIKAEAGAGAEARTQARQRAEALLAELRKNPASFAELARKQSEDPGSATRGGDLDWFARGAMVKPFEDAVFALKKGELSAVVESDFGYHVIELTDLRGGGQRSFEAVRTEIEAEVRQQLAQRRFVELAEQFTNLVEQEDSLKPVAERLKLELGQASAVSRQVRPDAKGPLAEQKLIDLVFAASTLDGKRNSEPLDLGGNRMAAVHVLTHRPAAKRALAEAREQVRQQVAQAKATQAARQLGESRLAQWKSKPQEAAAALSAAVVVSRQQARELPQALVDAALRAPIVEGGSWVGVDLGQAGYAVVRMNKVLPAAAEITRDAARVRAQYTQLWAAAEAQAYEAALKQRFKVSVKPLAAAAPESDR